MEVKTGPGKYIVAVSGGVDSVVLLDLLSKRSELELVVAHFDHGIRDDSEADKLFVEKLAHTKNIPFVYASGNLGKKASEAKARGARYVFLRKELKAHKAQAIITAHHQDDLIETAIINLLRGTGRKGLTSLGSRPDVVRPLLNIPKAQLIDYARKHDLKWREDSTNLDESYLRNYVRRNVVARFDAAARDKFLKIIRDMQATNAELEPLILDQLQGVGNLDRQWFNQLPHDVAREMMASWLRLNGVGDFDRKAIERLVVGAKTAAAGKQIEAVKGVKLVVGKDDLALTGAER